MSDQNPGQYFTGHHHVTIGVGDAQEDYDFHTKVLGLKNVKKTLFYDGAVPIYHFYYGNDTGEESTLLTTFPMAHTGVKATEGSGQVSFVSLSVPPSSLAYWKERLESHGLKATETERFGEKQLDFRTPHNIRYSMVEAPQDSRSPYSEGPVPAELRIHGTHSIGVSVRDMEFMAEFMQVAWGSRLEAEDTGLQRYAMGEGGSGAYIDFEIEPDRKAGSWIVGNGAVHHMAFNVASLEQQAEIKFFVEGLGYTDFSDVKDRGYFDSIYVRTPSGALFEACVSHPDGFTSDEPVESLGTGVMVAPQLEGSKEELLDVIGRVSD